MDDLEKLFKENESAPPQFSKDANWKVISKRMQYRNRIVMTSLSAAIVLIIFLSYQSFNTNSSLYDDDTFKEIISLEEKLERELDQIEIDTLAIKTDHRLADLMNEIKHINEQIEECKREIQRNPLNPNYHKALFALYKSKRRMYEIIKNRG